MLLMILDIVSITLDNKLFFKDTNIRHCPDHKIIDNAKIILVRHRLDKVLLTYTSLYLQQLTMNLQNSNQLLVHCIFKNSAFLISN